VGANTNGEEELMRGPVAVLLTLSLLLPALVNEAGAEEKEGKPWRGTLLTYRNVASAISLEKDAELTYNPYYAMYLGFGPRWWFSKVFYVAGDVGVTRELTEADDTTYSGEFLLDDVFLKAGAANFLTIPVVGLDFSGSFSAIAPTSKLSDARTLIVGLRADLFVSRTFPLLKGLTVAYGLQGTRYLHEYTTAERDSPLIPGCNSPTGQCEAHLNTGDLNAAWRLMNLFSLSVDFTDWIGMSGAFAVITDYLYDSVDDERVSYVPTQPTGSRYAMLYEAELYAKPLPSLGVGLGVSTVNPQLSPDSSREDPFINRYTALYLDLRFDFDGFLSQITGRE